METIIIGLVIYFVFFGFLGHYLGAMKKRAFDGMLIGILLGPIGCIIAVLLPEGKDEESSHGEGLAWRKTKEGQNYAKRKRR